MGGFGDLLGGLADLLGGGAAEGAASFVAEAISGESDEPRDADAAGSTRYLTGGPRRLDINDV